jgi:hypothetical protein
MKVTKAKAPLLLATLRFAKGNLCRGVCGVCRETHYALKALRSNRRGKLVDDALALCGASATPQTPRPRRMQKGWGGTASLDFFGARLLQAVGYWAPACPLSQRRGDQSMGWFGCRRAAKLRELTCGRCLNGAPWRVVSSAAQPMLWSPQVAPGTSLGEVFGVAGSGAAFFWVLFLAGQEKYLARRGETRPAALHQ